MSMKSDNELIAEFMCDYYEGGKYHFIVNRPFQLSLYAHELEYHLSWDWIMGVVGKIEGLRVERKKDNLAWCFSADISLTACDLRSYSRPTGEKFISFLFHVDSNTSKIQAVYKAVIEFIKWYNEQPK